MTITQVWGVLTILVVCPLLGGLPLIAWITYALTRRNLREIGTGNIGVQAAFYHGGTLAGILAVLSEAGKGIAAVMLARAFFPPGSEWELIALIGIVMGRYCVGKGAGTTNVVWGFVVHDVRVAGLVFLIGGISFTILRERQAGRIAVLILFPAILALLHPNEYPRIFAAIALALLIGWIYHRIPDDLDLPPQEGQRTSQKMFRFFRGDKAMISLNQQLDATKVGQKAATLSQLKRWGYSVPDGWVLLPGDDAAPLIESLSASQQQPLVVRSSAIGEDSESASAAGQYETILNVTNREALQQAILRCQASYHQPNAIEYRQQRYLPESAMAVLIQKQVFGAFSGVAFSRDPMVGHGDAVVIEALPGAASQIVSGKVTPEQYRVLLTAENSPHPPITIEGEGDVPQALIREVAILARELEARYHGIPQDIEWSYDGQTLWVLQSRPITTLWPIWTRKIAAEVIPGLIRPLTWSINRPLTCGVWGELFTLVLGKRAEGLDFNETATLHYSRAYFNASLLGQIFRRMGLPPESLEFLTRGAKFSKPAFRSTLQNVPGLLRLWRRELRLEKDFNRDYRRFFASGLAELSSHPVRSEDFSPLISPEALKSLLPILERIEFILNLIKRATYYSILAPLSLALRQAIFKVEHQELDTGKSPEVSSLRSIQELADAARFLLPQPKQINPLDTGDFAPDIFVILAESTDGQSILEQFNEFLHKYGYLSDVATDIAVPTWQEDPSSVRELFAQFVVNLPPKYMPPANPSMKARLVQSRLDLKGKVTEVYSKLLAELRWTFVALEKIWLESGILREEGDIFFLEFWEIERVILEGDTGLVNRFGEIIQERRSQFAQHHELPSVPPVVYGNNFSVASLTGTQESIEGARVLQGIGASSGQAEGRVKVLQNLQNVGEIHRDTILVVPYTDSGWAALLARAGGIISEVGGRLSHGAIVAREYGIPAVMDIHDATRLLRDGMWVKIDGGRGIVEII
ncbi:MAG TPA: glycerol-3-phosphate acyltransferase [Leptolyngbyaceae cyanobacterium]